MSENSGTTIRKLAEACGVSPATVSLAMRNDRQIAVKTRERIQLKAKEMGYRQNPLVSAFMARQRSTRPQPPMRASLAFLINVPKSWIDKSSCWYHYIKGAKRRALELGFNMDVFYLEDEPIPPVRLGQILRARNTHGVLLSGFFHIRPEAYLDFSEISPLIIGNSPRQSVLSGVDKDHVNMMDKLLAKLQEKGYRRIGMALHQASSFHSDYHYKVPYSHYQIGLSARNRIPLFELSGECQADFKKWLDQHKPDVVLSKYSIVPEWLAQMGLGSPHDIGYADIDLDDPASPFGGILFSDSYLAALAVDQLTSVVYRNEFGIPEHPHQVLVKGRIVDGQTLRPDPCGADKN